MVLIPYKVLVFENSFSKEEIIARFENLFIKSKDVNYFLATTNEILISKLKVTGREIKFRPKLEGRRLWPTRCVCRFEQDNNNPKITVTIRPSYLSLIFTIFFIGFIVVFPIPLIYKIIVVGIFYLVNLLAFTFGVWWVKDVFEKEIL